MLSYVAIAPNRLGLTMVIPESFENGQVALQIRTCEFKDSAELRKVAEELLPDIFDLDKSGVSSRARLEELLHLISKSQQVKTVDYPRMITAPGQQCAIEVGVSPPDSSFSGTRYALQADTIPDSEGWDLSVDVQDSGGRKQE